MSDCQACCMTQFSGRVIQVKKVMNSWNFYFSIRQKGFQDFSHGLLGMITNHPEQPLLEEIFCRLKILIRELQPLLRLSSHKLFLLSQERTAKRKTSP